MTEIPLRKRLIFALDAADADSALELVRHTRESVGTYKVGLELFTAVGPRILDALRTENAGIFLDLKLHDIPNTVAGAVRAAARHGVDLLTVHAAGGPAMLAAAQEALARGSSADAVHTRLLAVTVLTSLNAAELRAVGIHEEPQQVVARLAALASDAGLYGCVCSPEEAALVRRSTRPDFAIVTPGIRANTPVAHDDQSRTATAFDAVRAGADYVVVGRPIRMAPDPSAAARRFLDDISAGLEARP